MNMHTLRLLFGVIEHDGALFNSHTVVVVLVVRTGTGESLHSVL